MALTDRLHFPNAFRLLAAWAAASEVFAQDPVAAVAGSLASQPQNLPTTVSSGSGIQLLGYILLVLILAVASVTVLFKGGFLGVLTGASKAEKKLQIEESRSLGHRQYLVVASYEGRRFLLGVCPGSIEYLSGLDSDAVAPAGSFQELLPGDPKEGTGDASAGGEPRKPVRQEAPRAS